MPSRDAEEWGTRSADHVGCFCHFRKEEPRPASKQGCPLPGCGRWVAASGDAKAWNRGRVTQQDFRAERGGISLQGSVFGRMLRDWEEHWLGEGAEESMASVIDELVQELRQWAALSPAAGSSGAEVDL